MNFKFQKLAQPRQSVWHWRAVAALEVRAATSSTLQGVVADGYLENAIDCLD